MNYTILMDASEDICKATKTNSPNNVCSLKINSYGCEEINKPSNNNKEDKKDMNKILYAFLFLLF